MFLTVHTPLGIIIGQAVTNPLLAFLLGIVSHYLFDIIPHGDTNVPKKYLNPIHITLAGLIDLVVLAIYVIFLLSLNVEILSLNILLAVLGSWLPDILQAFYFKFQGKTLGRLQDFHNFFHDLISNKYQFQLIHGLIFQIIVLVFLTIIIII
jgi:hypothetical protein